jgi:hypothetical protein
MVQGENSKFLLNFIGNSIRSDAKSLPGVLIKRIALLVCRAWNR